MLIIKHDFGIYLRFTHEGIRYRFFLNSVSVSIRKWASQYRLNFLSLFPIVVRLFSALLDFHVSADKMAQVTIPSFCLLSRLKRFDRCQLNLKSLLHKTVWCLVISTLTTLRLNSNHFNGCGIKFVHFIEKLMKRLITFWLSQIVIHYFRNLKPKTQSLELTFRFQGHLL